MLCHEEEVQKRLSSLLVALDSICREVVDDLAENKSQSFHVVHRHLSATLLRVVHWYALRESVSTLLHDVLLWHLKYQSIFLASAGAALRFA